MKSTIRSMTIYSPNGEPMTLDLGVTIRLHPHANPIQAYLSTLTWEPDLSEIDVGWELKCPAPVRRWEMSAPVQVAAEVKALLEH